MSEHERFEDTAGAFVLGALPDDERAAYVAHLETCPTCRNEVDELSLAVEALPVSSPAVRPPPALKARIMAEVEREAALLASASEPRRDPRARRKWSFSWPSGAVAALACTALLGGLAAGALLFGGGGSETIPFKADPSLQQASATLEMTDSGAILVANGLPPTQDGEVYMVWIKRPGSDMPEPTSALFTPRSDGSATASVTGDLDDAEAVLVNTEPIGGSKTPTSPVLMTATLS